MKVQSDALQDVPRHIIGATRAGFRTMRLSLHSTGQAVLRPTLGVYAMMLLILGVGVECLVLGVGLFGKSGLSFTRALDLFGAVGFTAVGLVMTLFGVLSLVGPQRIRPIVIDRRHGHVRLGKQSPRDGLGGIQICAGRQKGVEDEDGKTHDYTVYELNLVFRTGQPRRVNLMTHGHQQVLRRDARRLAEFLGVPILDHTEGLSNAPADDSSNKEGPRGETL